MDLYTLPNVKEIPSGKQPHSTGNYIQYPVIHRSEWPSSKNLQTINAGEGVEKREPSCTVGGNVN